MPRTWGYHGTELQTKPGLFTFSTKPGHQPVTWEGPGGCKEMKFLVVIQNLVENVNDTDYFLFHLISTKILTMSSDEKTQEKRISQKCF